MLRRTLIIASLAVAPSAWAQDAPAPLTKEELATVVDEETFSLPMPGELFAALGKVGTLDWSKALRKTPSGVFTMRPQIALNLGTLMADGYLAVEAKDKAHVRRVAQDIKRLAKGLGVQDEIVSRGNSIVEFAEAGRWETLKEELEATQNEVVAAMVAHKDQELVTLVMLGGWLRGLEVVSTSVAKTYTEDGAKVLRQPAVVDHFVQRLAKMDPKFTDSTLMNSVRLSLFDIKKAVTFPPQKTPTEAEVKELATMASKVMETVSKKE